MSDMSMAQFSRFASITHALLRIVAGLAFAQHGAQKLFGMFGGFGGTPGATAPLMSLMGLAGVIEFAGGLLIAIGLFTRPVAFIAAGQMATAYFMAHMSRGGFWPIQNQGELALLYCFIFLTYLASGAGIWSVDGAIRGNRATV